MKRIFTVLVLLACSMQAFADFGWVEGTDVRYVGGTANGFSPDTMGHLGATSPAELVFISANGRINIPYEAITKFNYRQEYAHQYGFLAATVIELLKARRQQHFLDIAYRDASGNVQTIVLEVSKDAQAPLRATIQARMSHELRHAS